ncbi:MAG: hypothetical protein M3462_11110 [Chloroflexota bacterium]|nr:hypothetical protein [Chloroflexota bacterium]
MSDETPDALTVTLRLFDWQTIQEYMPSLPIMTGMRFAAAVEDAIERGEAMVRAGREGDRDGE